ncbi:MAG: type II toxin-antitoxin system VapC family toxin [Chloroflexi bacterium]|nr:type II toxin-antitoxin system VapC family toxin [Chloroflexota bacterium]
MLCPVRVRPFVQLLSSLGNQGLAVSLIGYGEIYEGAYYARDPKTSEEIFLQFVEGIKVLPLNEPVMRIFAGVRGDLRRQGQLIADMDLLIAATAITHDLTLITGNTGHFTRVPGLSLSKSAV